MSEQNPASTPESNQPEQSSEESTVPTVPTEPTESTEPTDSSRDAEAPEAAAVETAEVIESVEATEPAVPSAPVDAAAEADAAPESVAPQADSAPESAATEASDTTAAAAVDSEPADPAAEAESAAPAKSAESPDSAEPAETPAAPVPSPPKPSAIPSPSAVAKSVHKPAAPAAPALITTDHSASAAYGRVDESGTVFVRTSEGEREVGSYPGASDEQALTYFARKYDELFASAVLLEQRLGQPEVPAKDVQDGLEALREQVGEANVVGDLDALAAKLDQIQSGLVTKRNEENEHRAKAREAAGAEREAIVVEAEKIAAQPEDKTQWKQSGERMRQLLDDWKAHQRSATRLSRDVETGLWQRFSAARNSFDKARRAWFATLDANNAQAKATKERLVADAERLATSKDWAPTAGAFKRLMDEWRRAGRASRADDDKLWERFKTAQDSFFAAKDEVVAAEEEQFKGNLEVKEKLLVEAEAILPVTDLDKAKAALRSVQDRWDAAGKVPRADMDRVEKAMRRIEQTVRDAEDKKWKSSNPEVAARAQGMVDQLERAVEGLKQDLAKAEASGNASKVKKAQEALDARQAWLDQARAGVQEFGG